eukprot:1880979-Lingulodinium_polyedra.AAC.1
MGPCLPRLAAAGPYPGSGESSRRSAHLLLVTTGGRAGATTAAGGLGRLPGPPPWPGLQDGLRPRLDCTVENGGPSSSAADSKRS